MPKPQYTNPTRNTLLTIYMVRQFVTTYVHRLIDLGNISQPKTSLKTKKKTSSSPGGGIYVPQANGIEAAIELAKNTRDIVIGLNE